MSKIEEWRDLERPGGYAVSSLGKVRRNAHVDARGWSRTDAVLKPFYYFCKKSPDGKSKVGYVRLAADLKRWNVAIPQLVAEAFLPDVYDEAYHELLPIDGDYGNWELSNIAVRPRFAAKLENRLNQIARSTIAKSMQGSEAHAA